MKILVNNSRKIIIFKTSIRNKLKILNSIIPYNCSFYNNSSTVILIHMAKVMEYQLETVEGIIMLMTIMNRIENKSLAILYQEEWWQQPILMA